MNVGSIVKAILPCDGKGAVQWERGKIIYISRRALVQFFNNICGHNGNGIGIPRHCWMMDWDKIKEVGNG